MISSLEDEKFGIIINETYTNTNNSIKNRNIKIKITDYGAGLSEKDKK
jgi:citrate lyase gamma subunit